jgi:dGTP triphosphohydrolase
MLKAVIWAWMIEPPGLIARRHGQRRVIRDLFDGYLETPGMLPYQDEWARVSERGELERVRFICDHIASMTDAGARAVHAEITGAPIQALPWE